MNDPNLEPGGETQAAETSRLYYTAQGKAWPILSRSHLEIYENEARIRAVVLIPQKFSRLLRPAVRSLVRKVHRWRAGLGPQAKDPFFVKKLPAVPRRSLITVENLSPQNFSTAVDRWETRQPDGATGETQETDQRTIVLILREPWNHLASLLKAPQLDPPRPLRSEDFLYRWLEYAREYAGRTRFLADCGRVVRFNYPAWFSNLDYRRQLSGELGCAHSDFGLNSVSDFGGGSSFDGRNFHQQAQAMGVRERWRAYADHALMRQLCDDEEVRALSQQIFGEEPPLPRSRKPIPSSLVSLHQRRAA